MRYNLHRLNVLGVFIMDFLSFESIQAAFEALDLDQIHSDLMSAKAIIVQNGYMPAENVDAILKGLKSENFKQFIQAAGVTDEALGISLLDQVNPLDFDESLRNSILAIKELHTLVDTLHDCNYSGLDVKNISLLTESALVSLIQDEALMHGLISEDLSKFFNWNEYADSIKGDEYDLVTINAPITLNITNIDFLYRTVASKVA